MCALYCSTAAHDAKYTTQCIINKFIILFFLLRIHKISRTQTFVPRRILGVGYACPHRHFFGRQKVQKSKENHVTFRASALLDFINSATTKITFGITSGHKTDFDFSQFWPLVATPFLIHEVATVSRLRRIPGFVIRSEIYASTTDAVNTDRLYHPQRGIITGRIKFESMSSIKSRGEPESRLDSDRNGTPNEPIHNGATPRNATQRHAMHKV